MIKPKMKYKAVSYIEIVDEPEELVTGTDKSKPLVGKIVLVIFVKDKGWSLDEGIVVNQFDDGLKIAWKTYDGNVREDWFSNDKISVKEIIGEAYKNWLGQWVRKYY